MYDFLAFIDTFSAMLQLEFRNGLLLESELLRQLDQFWNSPGMIRFPRSMLIITCASIICDSKLQLFDLCLRETILS